MFTRATMCLSAISERFRNDAKLKYHDNFQGNYTSSREFILLFVPDWILENWWQLKMHFWKKNRMQILEIKVIYDFFNYLNVQYSIVIIDINDHNVIILIPRRLACNIECRYAKCLYKTIFCYSILHTWLWKQ